MLRHTVLLCRHMGQTTYARTSFPSFAAQSIAFVEQPSGRFSDNHCTTSRWPCMALTSIADFVHPCRKLKLR